MDRTFSLVIGGTRGLGKEIAKESMRRGIVPVVLGRSADTLMNDPEMNGMYIRSMDLTDPHDVRPIPWERSGYPRFSHVFWVAGIFMHRPLTDCTSEEITRMTAVHFTGPVTLLQYVHRLQKLERPLADDPGMPYHLVTIGSTLSWKVKEDEAVYCAMKAAKAHFTRCFAKELIRDLPGSKVTLVNPGGIRTPDFWAEDGRDISDFMDPAELARLIWDTVETQDGPFLELQVPRHDDGTPDPSFGPLAPEQP